MKAREKLRKMGGKEGREREREREGVRRREGGGERQTYYTRTAMTFPETTAF